LPSGGRRVGSAVGATAITGDYTCTGVASHDPATKMGKVDIKVRFTAKS